jgi:3-hydroxyacyl-[acyl-carrier-protein] dehydratase
MDLTLPLDHAAIERVLPHRYPFLLVDRIIEFEVDKRIVGIKNVSFNDPYLSRAIAGEAPGLPPTILIEGIAQVGAILILAKPENRQRVPLLTGIQRVRYRHAAQAGDVVVFEAVVVRLRRRVGVFKGLARVENETIVEGTMTFALASARDTRSAPEDADPADPADPPESFQA